MLLVFRWSQLPLFPIELLVEQEYKQVDVDGGPVKELHHGHPFILQLQEILRGHGGKIARWMLLFQDRGNQAHFLLIPVKST